MGPTTRMISRAAALIGIANVTALHGDEYEVVAHLKHRNLVQLEKVFWDISNPDHPMYLQHMTTEKIASIIGGTDVALKEARSWLVANGAEPSSIRVSALRDSVTGTFAKASTAEKILPSKSVDSTFGAHSVLTAAKPSGVEITLRRDLSARKAEEQQSLPRTFTSAHSSYIVQDIKKAYGIPTDLQATNKATQQMVWGPGTFGYSPSTLQSFKESQCPLLDVSKVKFDTENHGHQGDNFGEGQLDTQMISTFGLNVETLVSNTNTSASTEEGTGFGQAILDFLTELASRPKLPQVLSLSLGSLAPSSCELLCTEAAKRGHTKEECQKYLQGQRQVCMFTSQAEANRISTALQVLGVRGVTVFGSSGDGGSHFSFQSFPAGLWGMGKTLNEISCKFQMPVYPTGSQYVVSVGGTMWENRDPSKTVTWSTGNSGSGSGFSWEFPMPDHQKDIVAAYLKSTQGLPPLSSFNASGRAYPDISGIGVEGTSQSSPLIAGVFSLLMDHRLNQGLPPLGFVAPRIWSVAQKFPGEAFESVPVGNSKTSCDNGFPSTKNGWDPNTGFGSPIWSGLMKYFGSDSKLSEKPSKPLDPEVLV